MEKEDVCRELDQRIVAGLQQLSELKPGTVAYREATAALSDLMAARTAMQSEENKLEMAKMAASSDDKKLEEERHKWRWSEFFKGFISVLGLGLNVAVNRANVLDIITAEAGGTIIRSSAFKIFDRVSKT